MKKTIQLLITVTSMIFIPCHAEDQFNLNDDINYISDHYNSGYCELKSMEDIYSKEAIRKMTLAAFDDVLSFSVGAKSVVGEWVGNIRVFKIGKTLNPLFIELQDYAARKDIAEQIKTDRESIKKELSGLTSYYAKLIQENEILKDKIKEIVLKSKKPIATLSTEEMEGQIFSLMYKPMACNIYEMVMLEHSRGGQIIAEYLTSISKAAAYRNIEKFQQSLEQLESMQ